MTIASVHRRKKGKLGSPGPFFAEVVNHSDPENMGSIEVALIKLLPNFTRVRGDLYPVRYLSPFYGVTNNRTLGSNPASFDDTQKSYGMWMIPPDIGTTVIVMFIDSDPNLGFWIGCVQDRYQNHMVPGIAATENVHVSQEQKNKYNFGDKVTKLPSAEFLVKQNNLNNPIINDIKKPVHIFADVLMNQGLLADDVRGVTSSSARREYPSRVFGISTPGPPYAEGRKVQIGIDEKKEVPASKTGGTTFVMDDGDIYGDNELVRLRTRTGHQILMHNTKDLIYIANSKGTAWIELTSDGKIDIYAQDSVSIHTENDFNFRAERDINLESGRNINLHANAGLNISAIESSTLMMGKEGRLEFGSNFSILSNAELKLKSKGDISFTTEGAFKLAATNNVQIGAGGNVLVKGSQIHLNGSATAPVTDNPPEVPDQPPSPKKFNLPNTSKSVGWGNNVYYKADDIVSIMKRVPVHEPWEHHEDLNRENFKPDQTAADSYILPVSEKQKRDAERTPQTVDDASIDYKQNPNTAGVPPEPTGDKELNNLNAFLWMIRVCEGTSGPNGYRTQYTGRLFTSFADHPREAITAPINGRNITSTAAGAYQFLATTWDQCKKALGLTDFSPPNQDKAAIYLIKNAGALNDVKTGNFQVAVQKTNRIWASLPGAPYNQNPKTYTRALSFYKQAGGTVTT